MELCPHAPTILSTLSYCVHQISLGQHFAERRFQNLIIFELGGISCSVFVAFCCHFSF